MKKFLSVVAIFFLMMTSTVYAAGGLSVKIGKTSYKVNTASVVVNGNELYSEFSPYVKDGRTFVPLREITEKLGATVDWNGKNQTIVVSLDDQKVKLQIGTKVVYVNGKKQSVDEASIPQLATYTSPKKETKTMVPLRFLSEAFRYGVDWNQDSQTATITTSEVRNSNIVAVSLTSNTAKTAENTTKKNSDTIDYKDLEKNMPASNNKNYYQSSTEEKETEKLDKQLDRDNAKEVYDSVGIDLDEVQPQKRVITKKIKCDGPLNIVIDPGHGGKDSGAIAADNHTLEKDLNLIVATQLYQKLQDNGYNVTMTRDRDEYIKLVDRASLANDSGAELFLSIHFNSADKETPKGIEVLYASEKNIAIKDVEQKHFADELLKALLKTTSADSRGVKNRPDIIVLNKTLKVSALAELGFISNPTELETIKSPDYIDKLVDGLYNGIVNYIDKYVEE